MNCLLPWGSGGQGEKELTAGQRVVIPDGEMSTCKDAEREGSWHIWGMSRNQKVCSESVRRGAGWYEAANGLPWCTATWEAGRARGEAMARALLNVSNAINSCIYTRTYCWGHQLIRYSLWLWLRVFVVSNLDMNEDLESHCTHTGACSSNRELSEMRMN